MKGLEALAFHPLAKAIKPGDQVSIAGVYKGKSRAPFKDKDVFVALGPHGSKEPMALAVVTGVDQDLMELETIPDGAVLHLKPHTRKVSAVNARQENFEDVRALWIGKIPPACQSTIQKLGWIRNVLIANGAGT